MHELHDHLEIVITIKDVDREWQLKDHEAVLGPYRGQLQHVARQMAEALKVAAAPSSVMSRGWRGTAVTWRRARIYAKGLPRPWRRLRHRAVRHGLGV
jgi:hypothetical protein